MSEHVMSQAIVTGGGWWGGGILIFSELIGCLFILVAALVDDTEGGQYHGQRQVLQLCRHH